MLKRYWFNFVPSTSSSVLNIGCGITAYTEDDARNILEQMVFSFYSRREVLEVIIDVDINTLDGNHVRPNMSSPLIRGIWFPVM